MKNNSSRHLFRILLSTLGFVVLGFSGLLWGEWASPALDPLEGAPTAQAGLDREQLHSLVSGFDMLRDRLTYQRALLNHEGEGRIPPPPRPVYASLVPEEFEIALEFVLWLASAEERGKVENLLRTLEQLDSDTKAYKITVWEARWELGDAFRKEKIDRLKKIALQEEIVALEKEMKISAPAKQAHKPQTLRPAPDCKKSNCISGKIGDDRDYNRPLPSYAQVPAPQKKAKLTHEDLRSILANLDLQHETALKEIDELQKQFLKRIGNR